MQKF
jgi:hypothetical protein